MCNCFSLRNKKDGCLVLRQIGSVVPANTPVIIRGSADTYSLDIAAEAEQLTMHNDLSGCTLPAPANQEGKHYYTLGSGAQGLGLYPFMGVCIDANAAYLKTDALHAQGFKVVIDDSDTGIDAVGGTTETDKYYDLGGCRAAVVPAGIYISRGKKLVVR